MIGYVVCLPFDKEERNVVLVKKTHPEWQKGQWNGPGGKIEPGEGIFVASVREVEEETGLQTCLEDWKLFLTLTNYMQGWRVHFLRAFTNIRGCSTKTDEEVVTVPVRDLYNCPVIQNLKWIIPFALDKTGLVIPIEIEDRGEN